tara:strand:- start:1445 stop:1654 length:210 start_codon:yes stop_codon:yes gene_type:complete
MGTYLKLGADHYADARAAGKELGPDMLAFFIFGKMEGWDPKVGTQAVLDPETRKATARMLAGLIINLTA